MRKYYLIALFTFLAIHCKKDDIVINNPPPPPEVKIPTLTTYNVSNLNRYSVILLGEIADTGKAAMNEQGFVADTVSMPTTTRNLYKFSLSLDSTKTFSVTIVGFPANTSYFVRAYGVNPYGTGYGNEIKFTSFRENIFNGDVDLKTQQQVIDFGANNYSRINGGLNIDGPVTDLSPLKSLVVINNGFSVKNTLLKNFKGLDSLAFTGYIFPNSFRVENNQNLVDFSGLSRLSISRGYFYVLNNNSLMSLDGLDSFIAVGAGELRIQDCSKIQNINGLKKLVFTGGSVYLINNPSLTDIKGFGNLSSIGERLYISNNASLQNLDGLEKIQNLPWGIELTNNASLTDVDGLSNLNSIGDGSGQGAITINGNPALKNLSGFNRITRADYIYIQNNDLLTDLNGFNHLESVTHFLHIGHNPGISDLTGLEKLTTTGRLEILANTSLQNLKGLESLKTIENNAYSITIWSNDNLQSLTGLENLISADGTIQISLNKSLTDFCPLKSLFTLGYNQFFSAQNNAANPTATDIIINCP